MTVAGQFGFRPEVESRKLLLPFKGKYVIRKNEVDGMAFFEFNIRVNSWHHLKENSNNSIPHDTRTWLIK